MRTQRRAHAFLIALLMSLVIVPQASAQLSIRGGVNLTDFFGDDVPETEASRSLSYGISMALINVGPVQVVAEGYYRRKGAGWDALDALQTGGPVALDSTQVSALLPGGNAAGETFEFGLDYVEVPVLLRFNLPLLAERVRPYLQAGPAFGWQIDCGVELKITGAGGSGDTEAACDDLRSENLEATLREYETGVVLGGGLAVSVFGGAGALSLDARLTRGLSRLREGQDGPEVRNQAFSVLLGYSFGFY